MRGLCVKTWTAVQPSSSARSIALEMPPAEDTWAPYSTGQRYPGWSRAPARVGQVSRARLACRRGDAAQPAPRRPAGARLPPALRRDDDHDDRRPAGRHRARVRGPRHGVRHGARDRLRRPAGHPGARRRRRGSAVRPNPAEPRPRRRLARPGRCAGGNGCVRPHRDRRGGGDRRAPGRLRHRARPGAARGGRSRPADREPGPAPAGERPPGDVAEHDRRARARGRGRGRRRLEPGDRPGDRRRQLPRLRRPAPPHPRRAARQRRLARLRPRAPGGMAGVHLEDVALGLGAPVRDRKPRLRRVDRPRACDRRRAARRVRGRGR